MEKVAAVNATDNSEVMQALQQLLEQMKADGVGGQAAARIQLAISGGSQQGIIGAEDVHVGSMTFGAPPKP